MKDKSDNVNDMTVNYRLAKTVEDIQNYIGDSNVVAFDLETAPDAQYRGKERSALDPAKAHIVGCSFSVNQGSGIYVPIAHIPCYRNIDKEKFFEFIQKLLADRRITKIAHNLAFESAMVYNKLGIVIQEPVYDTMCAAQMVLQGNYEFRKLRECGLKTLANDILNVKLHTFEETVSEKYFDELDPCDEKTVRYAAADADFTLRLYHKFNEWFLGNIPRHKYIVEHLESPVAVYIGLMKVNGLTPNLSLMEQYRKKAESEMERLLNEIRLIIGEVNIGKSGNTQALKKCLYERNHLPLVKDTQTLDEDALILLEEYCKSDKADKKHTALSPLFSLLREYRSWGKTLSTYIDGLSKHINQATGRIHPNMFSLSTGTGRMNCSTPNAQNLPRKDNDPVGIRNVIQAQEGHVLLSLDFSQIELRVGAFYCRDEKMMQVYRNNGDIHAATTSVIYGISYSEASDKRAPQYKERRTIAKNVNFGTFYGLYPKGLQRTLKFKAGINKTEEECAEIISNIKKGYGRLISWQEKTKSEAERLGYVATWLGRRRYLPEIRSNDWTEKSSAERKALNMPIQGTAADIIKLAMARILKGLPNRKWLKPVLQIHDELLFMVPKDKVGIAADFIRSCMEVTPFEMCDVPLVVEVSVGQNYGEMKDLGAYNMSKIENANIMLTQTANAGSIADVRSVARDAHGAPAEVTAKDILSSIFAPNDTVCFRVFDDKKNSTFHGAKLECKCRDYLKDMEPKLREHNKKGRGVFFVVNYGGHTDKEITRINAQFVEMDDLSFDEQWKKVKSFPLPPSAVIRTRKSLHVYWFMRGNANVEHFNNIQKRLVEWFGGDPCCVNLS